jgi:hypothetical protein
MAIDARQLQACLNDTTSFRAWGLGLHAQLAAIGLVQTADTGQINWATVVHPGGGAGTLGYENWRFNDALQATKPVFIKLEFGFENFNCPRIICTVSTATNGSGAPAGQVGSAMTRSSNTSKSAGVTAWSYCSGDTSRLNLVTNHDPASNSYAIGFFVERTKTGAGVNTGDGIVVYCGGGGGSTSAKYNVIPFSGSIPAASTFNMATSLDNAGSSAVGPNVAVSPTLAPLGKVFYASWVVYKHADIGELQPFSADHLGGNHTMMPIGDGFDQASVCHGTVTGHSIAMLWE